MIFEWKDAYSVGIKAIDDQHKRLLVIGTELFELLKNKDDKYDEIYQVLVKLEEYTRYHFNFEEALLEKFKFPNLEKHIEEHGSFVEKIGELITSEYDELQQRINIELLTFVSNWIENHILKVDMEYSEFLASKL